MTDRRISRRDLLAGSAGLVLGAGGLLVPAQVHAANLVAVPAVSGIISSYDGFLNLRTGPGLSYPVITRLYNGQLLKITNTSGDWFKVTAAGRTGWLSSWYVYLTGTKSAEVRRGNTSRKRVALTFDCGSDYGYTDTILAILAKHGILASFGLTGDWMNSFPDGASSIADAGHQLLNHTLNHRSFTGLSTPGTGTRSPAKRLSQIQANEALIRKLTGRSAKPYWRPPYGDIDASVLQDAGALGFTKTAMWTIDSSAGMG